MPARIDNRRDVLLLLLHSPGITNAVNEPVVGRTRLVKMLFLFKQEVLPHFRKGTKITDENFYDFFPWNYGPFSRQVYDDLMFFSLKGFIQTSAAQEDTLPQSAAEWQLWLTTGGSAIDEETPTDYEEESFALTDIGVKFASNLYQTLNTEQKDLLRTFKRKMQGSSLRAILKYVYENYPDQIAKSQITSKVIGKP